MKKEDNDGYVQNYHNLEKNDSGFIGNIQEDVVTTVFSNARKKENHNFFGSYSSVVKKMVMPFNKKKKKSKKITKEKADKIFFFILIIIILISLSIYLFMSLFHDNGFFSEHLNYVFDPSKQIAVFDGSKYGYMNSTGDILIRPQYAKVTDFYGDYAGVIYDEELESYAIIDSTGKEIIAQQGGSEPKYIIDYDIWVIGDSFYNRELKQISPAEMKVVYTDNGLFVFKDNTKSQYGVLNYKGEVLYSLMDEGNVSIEISQSDYETDELFLKVSSSLGKFVASTKTDSSVYKFDNGAEVLVHNNGIFSIKTQGQKQQFLCFRDGKLKAEVNSADMVYVADYDNQIIYSVSDGITKYFDMKNGINIEPINFNEHLGVDENSIKYKYQIVDCGSSKGLVMDDKVVLSCQYSDIMLLDINLFNYIKKKKNQEIILLRKNNSIIIYDLKNNREINEFKNAKVKISDDSVFLLFNMEDETANSDYYVVYNLLTDIYSEISGINLNLDIHSSYYTVMSGSMLSYYNSDFGRVYQVNLNK